ncbi:DUF3313 domain-containing protein [Phenylobacterium sp.]|uniref:DUF3313 domain-containing protein n=1 Tax=Phenylobacterium sp. TaxID=1871053 RepID=UPI0008B1ECE6|nr:MAG: hypothetical protein A2882_05150 [Phenylobacterium sp. RIFCSPHIGHO2_01_FULL_70_10]
MTKSLSRLAAPGLLLALSACAATPERGAFLSSYDGLEARTDMVRAGALDRTDAEALGAIRRVAIAPAVFAPADGAKLWMTPQEQARVLREVDAQLCFELSERFEIASAAPADAQVRAAVTDVRPTGRAGSAAAAAAAFFIPGPIGLRAPGTLGGLSAEAEMLDPAGEQVAAIVWSRSATAVGTDNPSLSRIGDALQFAEPFADAAAAAMTPEDREPRDLGAGDDPCAEYGPRFRPEGFLSRFATGLYIPDTSAARPEATEE